MKKRDFIYIGILVVLLILGYVGCNKYQNLKNDLNISNQNVKALNDTVRITKNKVGDLESSKNVLISEKGKLGDLNKTLSDELAKEKGKVSELNHIVATIQNQKPIIITNTIVKYPNGEYGLSWCYDTTYNKFNSRYISGISKFKLDSITVSPLNTIIDADTIRFNLVTGLRESKGNFEIFARSDYPGLVITDIEGAIIDPKNNPIVKNFIKKSKFAVGPYIGVGFNQEFKPSIQVGIGVSFSLIRF